MVPAAKSWKQELEAGHQDSKKRVGFVWIVVGAFLENQMHYSKLVNFASDVLPFGILGKSLMLWERCDEPLISPSTLHLRIVQNFNRESQISDRFLVLILKKEAIFLKVTFFTWLFLRIVKQLPSSCQVMLHCHTDLPSLSCLAISATGDILT